MKTELTLFEKVLVVAVVLWVVFVVVCWAIVRALARMSFELINGLS